MRFFWENVIETNEFVVPTDRLKMQTPLIPDIHYLNEIAFYFHALSEPSRLTLLNLIKENEALNVQELVEMSGMKQANVSKHLGLLLEARIIKRRKEGVMAYYSLDDHTVPGLCLLVYNRLKTLENAL